MDQFTPNHSDYMFIDSCIDMYNIEKYLNATDISQLFKTITRIPRYLGRHDSNELITVGMHSIIVSEIMVLEGKDQLHGLIHDIGEAITGDIITPVKSMCPELNQLEGLIDV
jgi:5'-deoxynucleotidase YfbR-like HD superfamily hydrolase